jgi:hypothetical protein
MTLSLSKVSEQLRRYFAPDKDKDGRAGLWHDYFARRGHFICNTASAVRPFGGQ